MNDNKRYKIESLRDIASRFRVPGFAAFTNCWNAMAKSSQKSKINYLFQFVNFILIVLLMLVILPERLDQWFSSFREFEWAFLPIGNIVATIISYFIFQTFSWVSDYSLADIFETSLKITLSLTVGLSLFILLLYNKLALAFKERVRQDLVL